MKTIWKMRFPVRSTFSVSMREGAEILSVHGSYIYALLDPQAAEETRTFRVVGTETAIEEPIGVFIDTFEHGGVVWHLFEIK